MANDEWQPSWYSFEGREYRTIRNRVTGEFVIPHAVARAVGMKYLAMVEEGQDVRREG